MVGFFAAGFSFQKGHRLLNVPYDPYAAYLFDGEEMSMALRMFTHGYDFYAPDRDIAYHLYSPNANKIRPVFWESDWSHKWKHARESEYRINYVMQLHQIFHPAIAQNSYDLREIDKYGLGTHRRSQDFWDFARIDLNNLTSEDLCPLYSQGGMDVYRVPWIDIENDPFFGHFDDDTDNDNTNQNHLVAVQRKHKQENKRHSKREKRQRRRDKDRHKRKKEKRKNYWEKRQKEKKEENENHAKSTAAKSEHDSRQEHR